MKLTLSTITLFMSHIKFFITSSLIVYSVKVLDQHKNK